MIKDTLNRKTTLLTTLALLALPLTTLAQTTATDTTLTTTNTAAPSVGGNHEITLGGGGASNKDFDSSLGSLDFGFGTYFSPRSELVLRQSIAYANPDNGDKGWSGATRLAYDYHLADGTTRPFLGASAGRIYGNTVDDTWAAGLEGGVKFFVKPQTFILAMASYDWFFDNGSEIDNQFSDGRFGWTLGVGFQF